MRFRSRDTVVLIAVAVLCAACTSNVSGKGTGHSMAAGSTAPITAASTSPSPSSTGSGSGGPPSDWVAHVNFGSLPHSDIDCSGAGLGGKVDILKVVSADVTGDGLPEAIVQMQCAHSASEWPDSVDVYSDRSGTPTVIGKLVTQKDASYVSSISTKGPEVTIGLVTGSKYAAGCCPDLNYTRAFTWNGSGFLAGPLLNVVKACGDTAFDVTAADQQGATGHGSAVLRFHNRLPQPCTIKGYPGLDAVTSSGAVLAHATRTLNGFAGGAHSISTITVGSGNTVSALVEWMNFNPSTGGSCATSTAIMVTPANTTNTTELPVQVSVCNLQVHPTVSGTSGDG